MSSKNHIHASFHHKSFVRKGSGPFLQVWCHDLSTEDIHLEMSEEFSKGDLVDIELMLGPDEPHPLRFQGRVTGFDDEKMEVKFKGLSEEQKEQPFLA